MDVDSSEEDDKIICTVEGHGDEGAVEDEEVEDPDNIDIVISSGNEGVISSDKEGGCADESHDEDEEESEQEELLDKIFKVTELALRIFGVKDDLGVSAGVDTDTFDTKIVMFP